MTGRVMTVTGPAEPGDLGATNLHDHVLIGPGTVAMTDSDLLLDDPSEAEAELEAYGAAGGGAVVDALPAGCGRRPAELAAASSRTRVLVIATTGFHTVQYYPSWHWAQRHSADQLTTLLLAEVLTGIDRHDYYSPLVERTSVRPGVLKWGTSFHRTDTFEAKTLEVVGALHSASDLPVLTHAEHGTHALEQLQLLASMGVPASRVAVSHMDRNPDPAVHLEVARQGATLIYDGLYRERYRPVSAVLTCLRALVGAGYQKQVAVGGDLARRSLRRQAGTEGMAGLLSHFASRCRAEVGQDAWHHLFHLNAARFLTHSIHD